MTLFPGNIYFKRELFVFRILDPPSGGQRRDLRSFLVDGSGPASAFRLEILPSEVFADPDEPDAKGQPKPLAKLGCPFLKCDSKKNELWE